MAYTAPTADDLILRYPAFASVDPSRIEYWLVDAALECTRFPEEARAKAEMAYAAHHMAAQGALSEGVSLAGITSFRSGTFSASISDVAAARTGYSSTLYGQEFIALQRRYFGGPRLVGPTCV